MRRYFISLQGPILFALLLMTGVLPVSHSQADPSLLPDDSLLTVRIDSLSDLYESPIVSQIWERLQASRQLADAFETVESQQLQEAVAYFEQRLGRSWQETYSELSTHGIDVAVQIDGDPQLLLIANADDETIVGDVVDAVVELTRADGANGSREVKSGEHRGYTGYRIGNVAIAAVGSRLLIASHPDLLKRTVDRILDDPTDSSEAADANGFHINVRVHLDRLRSLPDVTKGLAIPSEDAGVMLLFGGWIDMLSRHQTADFHFQLNDDSIEAVLQLAGAESPSSSELAGFWADSPDEDPAPLLRVPGTIYSTTWYRDYGSLWDHRDDLVTAKVVKEMERGDREAAAQFEALGSAVLLSKVVKQFGPRFRIVVAEQPAPPYDIELRNQLPAAALVIELEDEKSFREIAAPFARVVHLILSFEQKMTVDPIEYAGATLHRLSQPYTDQEVSRRDRVSYNFRVAHTITRGHMIIGSTPEIVRQTIDALDAQADEEARVTSGVTSQQFVDLSRMTAALENLRDAIVRQSVLGSGLDVETAHHEFDILLSIFRLFDTKSITGQFTEDGFEHRVRVTTTPSPGQRTTTLAD